MQEHIIQQCSIIQKQCTTIQKGILKTSYSAWPKHENTQIITLIQVC